MHFTIEEAFKIFYLFLDAQYEKTKSEDLGWLMGGMSWNNITGCKPIFWSYWKDSVEEVVGEKIGMSLRLTEDNLILSIYYFLEKIFDDNINDPQIKKILDKKNFGKGFFFDVDLQKDWYESVKKVENKLVDEAEFNQILFK
ncbi:MAG TPA: hypothetical protein VJ201_08415 [Candidatus Babeliales bacterium]|nr:hypothetical protein [Candidatus Babeliales bacterium]